MNFEPNDNQLCSRILNIKILHNDWRFVQHSGITTKQYRFELCHFTLQNIDLSLTKSKEINFAYNIQNKLLFYVLFLSEPK